MYIIFYVNKREFTTCTDRVGVSKVLSEYLNKRVPVDTVRNWFRNRAKWHYIKGSCIIVARPVKHVKSNRTFNKKGNGNK